MRLGGGGDVVVVGDEQDRLAARVQAAEQLEHLVAALGVERTGRLVGQQQRRLVGQGAGDGQPLALAAGQRRRATALALSPRPSRSSRSRARVSAGLRLRPAMTAGSDHVLERGHALEQVEELEDDADVACGACGPARPRPARSPARRPATISPSSAVSSPATRLSSVDLPQPDGPMIADELAAAIVEVGAPQRPHRRVLGLEGAVARTRTPHDGLDRASGHRIARSTRLVDAPSPCSPRTASFDPVRRSDRSARGPSTELVRLERARRRGGRRGSAAHVASLTARSRRRSANCCRRWHRFTVSPTSVYSSRSSEPSSAAATSPVDSPMPSPNGGEPVGLPPLVDRVLRGVHRQRRGRPRGRRGRPAGSARRTRPSPRRRRTASRCRPRRGWPGSSRPGAR